VIRWRLRVDWLWRPRGEQQLARYHVSMGISGKQLACAIARQVVIPAPAAWLPCCAALAKVLPPREHLGDNKADVSRSGRSDFGNYSGPRFFAAWRFAEHRMVAVIRESAFEFCVSLLGSLRYPRLASVLLGCAMLGSGVFLEVVSIGSRADRALPRLGSGRAPRYAPGSGKLRAPSDLVEHRARGMLKTAGSDTFCNSSSGPSILFVEALCRLAYATCSKAWLRLGCSVSTRASRRNFAGLSCRVTREPTPGITKHVETRDGGCRAFLGGPAGNDDRFLGSCRQSGTHNSGDVAGVFSRRRRTGDKFCEGC
jgi:hypothetical protein